MNNPKSHIERLSKTHNVMFSFFSFSSNFLITFENTQAIVLYTMYILPYKPPSVTNGDQKITFNHIFCVAKLVVEAKQLYIFV